MAKRTLIRTFDKAGEAQEFLDENRQNPAYKDHKRYIVVGDAALLIVKEQGSIKKLYAGEVDNTDDVHLVIVTPEQIYAA